MIKRLSRDDRMRLMKFVCSFAWADLEVQPEERKFVADLVRRLELDEAEAEQVDAWLATPPRPSEVDPGEIPKGHRQLFIDTVRALIVADGVIDDDELENLVLFRMLLT